MTDEHRGPELVRDDALTAALRAIYRKPAGEAYWAALEARIMARIADAEAWWTVPDRWLRVGLAAAAAALILAGGMFLRAQSHINRTLAADAIVEVDGLGSSLAQREPISSDEAALRKLTGRQ
ncbi:MAG: hypothetical protein IT356_09470 [Gemmatimonadaceae bacterium]|nr:hypothetical protein [Gemmatimonadaceae bacterium]